MLQGLEQLSSVSRAGISEVTLELGWDADMDILAMDIREKLDRLVLPDEAEAPIVLRYDPSLDPIMRLAFSGDQDLTQLRYVAEDKVKEALERIDGVIEHEQEVRHIHVIVVVDPLGLDAPAQYFDSVHDSLLWRCSGSIHNTRLVSNADKRY